MHSLAEVLGDCEIQLVRLVQKLLMITLFMDDPFAVDGTMATSPSHQQGPYLYYVSKRTVWGEGLENDKFWWISTDRNFVDNFLHLVIYLALVANI